MPKTKDKPTQQDKAKKAAKKGKVHLFVLIDESGSMNHLQEAVVSGCNEFLSTFKDNEQARAWIGFFDDGGDDQKLRIKVRDKKASKAEPLTNADYNPRGMTPLNDAILYSLRELDKTVKDDETVFMAIITDGIENASEADAATVAAAIKKREDKKNWSFVYVGANQQSEQVAAGLGLGKKGQSFNFGATRGGVKATMRTTSHLAGATVENYATYGNTAQAKNLADVTRGGTYDETRGIIEDDED